MSKFHLDEIAFLPHGGSSGDVLSLDPAARAPFDLASELATRIETLHSFSIQMAMSYLDGVNLSKFGIEDANEACEALLDALELLRSDIFDERVTIPHDLSIASPKPFSADRHAIVAPILLGTTEPKRPLVVHDVPLGSAVHTPSVLIRVCVRWE